MSNYEDVFKKVVAHCKEYGYVFQSSEIYDGLAAAYDYGPNGVELKNNIKKDAFGWVLELTIVSFFLVPYEKSSDKK